MTWDALPSGKRGRQQKYSDVNIQTCLTIKALFGLPLRQTTGYLENLLELAGLDWTSAPCVDHCPAVAACSDERDF